MRMRIIHILSTVFIFSLMASCAYSKSIQAESGAATHPLSATIQFYQGPLNHLDAVRMGECPMYPSCSQYGLESIQKHGALMGWIMTMDRLMRCGRDEIRLSPPVIVDGRLKSYDPLEKNDFWRRDQQVTDRFKR